MRREHVHPYSGGHYRTIGYEVKCDKPALKTPNCQLKVIALLKASNVAECVRILMDMEICRVRKMCRLRSRKCCFFFSFSFFPPPSVFFASMLVFQCDSHVNTSTNLTNLNPPTNHHTQTHTQAHALDVSCAPHCWLVARVTPHRWIKDTNSP